jgi:nitrous oxidase accessory protein
MHKFHLWAPTLVVLMLFCTHLKAGKLRVGEGTPNANLLATVELAKPYDTLLIGKGNYVLDKVVLNKPLTFIGVPGAVITGKKGRIIEVTSDGVTFINLTFIDVPTSYTNDDAAVKFTKVQSGRVEGCTFNACFFAVYVAHSQAITIRNNTIRSTFKDEAGSGNAIHCWYSKNLKISNNQVSGHRDGIYLEFVENSTITGNGSHNNLRYGLHFMFSHNNTYERNIFKHNGAGCAVMYSNQVTMRNNRFVENWGPAAYGLLLKDIKDSELTGNVFYHNTVAIHMDNAMRITMNGNEFRENGWGMRIMGNCMESAIKANNFVDNSFQVATNSQYNHNHFNGNYWSDYTGYDLNRDGKGDVPHRPVTLYTYMVTQNGPTVILMRSFIIDLMNLAEKVMPTMTPETLQDKEPLIKPAHVTH